MEQTDREKLVEESKKQEYGEGIKKQADVMINELSKSIDKVKEQINTILQSLNDLEKNFLINSDTKAEL